MQQQHSKIILKLLEKQNKEHEHIECSCKSSTLSFVEILRIFCMIKEGLFICRGGRSGAVVIYKFVCVFCREVPLLLYSLLILCTLSENIDFEPSLH